jgi:hypothetical protein
MTRFFTHPSAAVSLCALACGGPALAQAPSPRLDVTQACTGITELLEQALAPALQALGQSGSSEVTFRWHAGKAELVALHGGPTAYRPALRQALRGLDCASAAAGQHFRFQLRFAPDGEIVAPVRLARSPG